MWIFWIFCIIFALIFLDAILDIYKQYKYEEQKNDDNGKIKRERNFVIFEYIQMYFILVIMGTCGCIYLSNKNLQYDIKQYTEIKYTVEQSLQNETISDLERIELIKLANDKNEWLEKTKYEVQQWYRFYLDKDLVLSLERINI